MKTFIVLVLTSASVLYGQAIKVPQTDSSAAKKVVLTPTQARMVLDIQDQINALPEVRILYARREGILAGIATTAGFQRWRVVADDKQNLVVEEVTDAKEAKEIK